MITPLYSFFKKVMLTEFLTWNQESTGDKKHLKITTIPGEIK
jgi:hypothetical protein